MSILSSQTNSYLESYILYEVEIESLRLTLKSGKNYEFPETLSNGRANYVLFEELIRKITGLRKTERSDHTSKNNETYEQKAYYDTELYPESKYDLFQTSASSTFGANNNGPKIKKFLETNKYEEALALCRQTGYDHNDFYIYTNTRDFNPKIPMRFFIVPTRDVIANLSKDDPRLISRSKIMSMVKSHKKIQ